MIHFDRKNNIEAKEIGGKTKKIFSDVWLYLIFSALKEEERDPIEAPPGPYKLQPENQEKN